MPDHHPKDVTGDIPAPARIGLRLAAGERVPSSQVSARTRSSLTPLFTAGIIKAETSPRGEVLVGVEVAHLKTWLEREYPVLTNTLSASSAGAQNLILARNTKATRRRNRTLGLLLRGFENVTVLRNGVIVPVGELTAAHGVAAVALGPSDSLVVTGECALVENPEVFWDFGPQHGMTERLAVLKGGRAPDQLLEWMKGCLDATFVIHVDFDPVGLDEYRRCRQAVGERARLFLPPNLAELFARFNNPALLAKERSLEILRALRNETDPAIRAVIDLIDRHHAGLEHESLTIREKTESEGS